MSGPRYEIEIQAFLAPPRLKTSTIFKKKKKKKKKRLPIPNSQLLRGLLGLFFEFGFYLFVCLFVFCFCFVLRQRPDYSLSFCPTLPPPQKKALGAEEMAQ
jgi:hypothetical protein